MRIKLADQILSASRCNFQSEIKRTIPKRSPKTIPCVSSAPTETSSEKSSTTKPSNITQHVIAENKKRLKHQHQYYQLPKSSRLLLPRHRKLHPRFLSPDPHIVLPRKNESKIAHQVIRCRHFGSWT